MNLSLPRMKDNVKRDNQNARDNKSKLETLIKGTFQIKASDSERMQSVRVRVYIEVGIIASETGRNQRCVMDVKQLVLAGIFYNGSHVARAAPTLSSH